MFRVSNHASRAGWSAGVVVASVLVLSGCAARQGSFSSRFVKQGEPAVRLEAPRPIEPPEGLGDYIRRMRAVQANARTTTSLLPTIESQDSALARSLLKLSLHESAEHHREVAVAYRAAGVTDYAYRHLQRAIRLDRCDAAAYEELARLWRDGGMPDLALGDAHRAIHCRPQSASGYNTLGTVLAVLGQVDNARRAFEFALMLDDRAAYALNNLCYLSLNEGNAAAAERDCARAVALDPTMLVAQTNLALAYALQGDLSRAERRLLDGPDAAKSHYNVGILRMAAGSYSEAAEAFEAALSVRPSLANAARRAVQARRLALAGKDH